MCNNFKSQSDKSQTLFINPARQVIFERVVAGSCVSWLWSLEEVLSCEVVNRNFHQHVLRIWKVRTNFTTSKLKLYHVNPIETKSAIMWYLKIIAIHSSLYPTSLWKFWHIPTRMIFLVLRIKTSSIIEPNLKFWILQHFQLVLTFNTIHH